MTKKAFYFEVSVSKAGTSSSKIDPYKYGDRCQWVRKGSPRDTYSECMQDAIANGERPYRIRQEIVPVAAAAPAA